MYPMLLAACAFLAAPLAAPAATPSTTMAPGATTMSHEVPPCPGYAFTCAGTATPAFGPDGRLWLAWTADGYVLVASSRDDGGHFTRPVRVNRRPVRLDAGADARPQILVDRRGRILVAWTEIPADPFTGRILFSRSRDGGRSFSRPQALRPGPAGQRFVSLAQDDSTGRIMAAWVDKRPAQAATAAGHSYTGAAIAVAWSDDFGRRFRPATVTQDNTCECCRLGMAYAGPDRPVLMWRNLFDGGVRDHAVMTFSGTEPGPARRVSVDDWEIEACPHHGPDLAAEGSVYHVAWFTAGPERKGLFYARSADEGRTFTQPMALGTSGRQASRPQVLLVPGAVWLAWKEFDGERTTIMAMASADGGTTWSTPQPLAATGGGSDHPLLITAAGRGYLSWLSREEGYRLLPLPERPAPAG